MARIIPVSDPEDERLAPYTRLRDPALRRAVEAPGPHGHGLFVAEGKIVLPRLVASRYPIVSVLLSPARLAQLEPLLQAHDLTVYVAEQAVMDKVTGYHLHRGVVAAGARLPLPDPPELLAASRRVVVLEDLTDQENLGAIVRSAVALGIDAMLLDPRCCDPLYRRVVRVSMGWSLHLPYARLDPWPASLAMLAAHGFRLLALSPRAEARPIDTFAVGREERLALLLGAEGSGLSAAALSAADELVTIPQRASVNSLNVGHAAAIAFHRLAAPGATG